MNYFVAIIIILSVFLQPLHTNGQTGTKPTVTLYPSASSKIVHHKYYSLAYSEANEQAQWVFYRLTPDFVNGTAKRKDNFRPDPAILTGSATPDDYTNSGYDRGHLCPAASMKKNQTAMDETFYMSNMSPQHPGLNRGRWKDLEEKERDWTLKKGGLIVVTGPIFPKQPKKIGKNEVTVPSSYYKIIYDTQKQMVGFIMPNDKCLLELNDYCTTVDSIESVTKIDFFKDMDDQLEKQLESKFDLQFWFN
jgi:endonuclease G